MTVQADPRDDMTLIVGSYTVSMPHVKAKGEGISVLRLDGRDGRLKPVSTFGGLRNPSYLALSEDRSRLYVVEEVPDEDGASAATLSFDGETGTLSLLKSVPAMGDAPCHIALDRSGERLFVCNYGSGNFITYALDADGLPSGEPVNIRHQSKGANPERQEGPHLHQATATPDGRSVLICDAGTDVIARYDIASGLIRPSPDMVVKARPGTLPRHLVVSEDGRFVFVVHELGCTISSYACEPEGFRPLTEVSTLPGDFEGSSACAAIRIHPSGRFVYASNRGHDSIAAYEILPDDGSLRSIGWYDTRGKAPRDFAIDPTGRTLVAANQDSHSLSVFRIDQSSGELTITGELFDIGSPVCVLFA
ncbi:lactonase family protein [Rhizobium deserti]|nr:lactonase family protein [Rhizobium deserti]